LKPLFIIIEQFKALVLSMKVEHLCDFHFNSCGHNNVLTLIPKCNQSLTLEKNRMLDNLNTLVITMSLGTNDNLLARLRSLMNKVI